MEQRKMNTLLTEFKDGSQIYSSEYNYKLKPKWLTRCTRLHIVYSTTVN